MLTVEYEIFEVTLANGMTLQCADHHLLIDQCGMEIRAIDAVGKFVETEFGYSEVLSIETLGSSENMYDLELDDDKHVYYTNGILSHNSTIIAIYILWFTIFHEDKKCLVASNKNSNAIEIMSRIEYAYEELPMWLKPGCKYFNKHSVEFDNGSKVESQGTTEKTGRGGSYSLVMIDELAFVNRRIQDAMWISLAPTISTGGSIIVSSTPNGDQDLFATLWRKAEMKNSAPGEENFEPVRVFWDEHPDRDANFKKTMIGKVGERYWLQEYECVFVSSDALLINTIKLQGLKAKTPLFEDRGFRFWKDTLDTASTYFIASDIATRSW